MFAELLVRIFTTRPWENCMYKEEIISQVDICKDLPYGVGSKLTKTWDNTSIGEQESVNLCNL